MSFGQNFGHMMKYSDEIIKAHCKPLLGSSMLDAVAIRRKEESMPVSSPSQARVFSLSASTPRDGKKPQVVFLGDICASVDERLLKANGITHVVNLCEKCPSPFPSLRYLSLLIPSEEGGLINHPSQLIYENLNQIIDFINVAMEKEGGSVLIHSTRGASRGFLAAAAYLIKTYGWTVDQASTHIMNLRPAVEPSDAVVAKILQFAIELQQEKPS